MYPGAQRRRDLRPHLLRPEGDRLGVPARSRTAGAMAEPPAGPSPTRTSTTTGAPTRASPARSTGGCSTTSGPARSTPWSSGTSTASTANPREFEEFFDVCDEARRPTSLASVDRRYRPGDPRRPVPGAYPRSRGPQGKRRQEPPDQPQAPGAGQAGKSSGGTRPFGYRADRRTVEPSEAAPIREAAARIRAGDSLRSDRDRLERPRRPVGPGRRGPSGPPPDARLGPAVRPARLPGEIVAKANGSRSSRPRTRPSSGPSSTDRGADPTRDRPPLPAVRRPAPLRRLCGSILVARRARTARAATSAPRARAFLAAARSRSSPSR